jgi:hypothetical protein
MKQPFFVLHPAERPLRRLLPLPAAAAPQWPRHAWGADALEVLCGNMLDSLPKCDVELFSQWIESHEVDPLRWMTACSGTDSPHWCFEALRASLQKRFPASTLQFDSMFRNVAAAELDERKRGWILRRSRAEVVYADMSAFSNETAYDHRSSKVVAVEDFLGKMILAGFSCKTASSLARSQPDQKECVSGDAMKGTTGETLSKLLDMF